MSNTLIPTTTGRKSFSRDFLGAVSGKKAMEVAFKYLTTIQQESAEVQLAGMSVMHLLVCQHVGLDPIHALNIADNMINRQGLIKQEHLMAIREYLSKELKRPEGLKPY